MSPHAVFTSTPRLRITEELKQFAVTKNAFLPERSPCAMLTSSYYDPWELIAQHLPTYIEEDKIRAAVKRMPVLNTDRLISEPEWRRAYVLLSFLTHAYVWGGDKPEEILPPQLAKPFKAVAAHLEVPPVLTYAGANLWNFTTTSTDFTDIDHLRTLVTFTGTESESWFLLISVAMEAKAAGIIQTMIKALEAVKRRDYEVISKALEDLRVCIDEIGVLLDRMYEKCDPMIFYYRIRPFLAGTKNMEAAGLPRGLFFDEGKGKGEWTQWRGGSNGQSSLIQFFDVVLGIEHTSHGSAGQKSFHSEVREYMPGPHHRFLDHVARMGSIRELAMAIGETTMSKEQVDLRTAYTATTDALTQFRNKHIQIVAKYIILPSKQPWTGGSKKNLASSCSESNSKGSGEGEKKQEQGLTGTGGTPLVPFLKRSRDETTEAGKLLRPGAESKKIRVVEEEGKLHAKRQRIHH